MNGRPRARRLDKRRVMAFLIKFHIAMHFITNQNEKNSSIESVMNSTVNIFSLSEAVLSLCLIRYHNFRLADIDYNSSGPTWLITHRDL